MLYYIAKYVLKPIFSVLYGVRLKGRENVPKDMAYIACANHVTGVDPVLIAIAVPFRIYPMAKIELFKNPILATLFRWLGAFPVKRGEADLKSIKIALKLLNDHKVLGIFPEGTRNKTDETIAEPGLAMLAIRAKVPVLPISIKGDYKLFHRTEILIGKPVYLDAYHGRKMHNEEYSQISYDIMNNIKKASKGEANDHFTG